MLYGARGLVVVLACLISSITMLSLGTAQQVASSRVKSGLLTIEYRDPADRAQIPFVVDAWRGTVRDLERIGLTPRAATIAAFSSAQEFASATGEPWFISASTLGMTIRTQRLSALRKRGILELTIRHEAFHTVQPATLPRWLAEGLARHFSGESERDPRGPTNLETVSDGALEELLLGRGDQSKLNAAYREATRRASRLVRARGWKVALEMRE